MFVNIVKTIDLYILVGELCVHYISIKLLKNISALRTGYYVLKSRHRASSGQRYMVFVKLQEKETLGPWAGRSPFTQTPFVALEAVLAHTSREFM